MKKKPKKKTRSIKRKKLRNNKKLRNKKRFKKKKKYTRRKKIKNIKKIRNKVKIKKKINLPLSRLKKIKLPKLKKIKFPKFNKKQLFKTKKKLKEITKSSLQNALNYILTPLFKAYDNYTEKKRVNKLKQIEFSNQEKEKRKKEEKQLRLEKKQKELRDEIKLARDRSIDLKKFIRQEQASLRREQALKRRRFLEEIKLERKIESFRKRELQEIKNLEKLALREQRDDYKGVEERLEKIKEKYRLIRDQKIRERVESLGVAISDTDTREDLLQKEREYAEHRNTIELVLESFYRSANSLVFQLNKKYIPKHKSILRVIDRRYESNECFIRYDDSPDEDWLILIYLEDSDAKKGKIIVENKANAEKHETKSFEIKEIFTYSDYLVDAMTAHIDRERQKKAT
mgnify:CR=1 FL=1